MTSTSQNDDSDIWVVLRIDPLFEAEIDRYVAGAFTNRIAAYSLFQELNVDVPDGVYYIIESTNLRTKEFQTLVRSID